MHTKGMLVAADGAGDGVLMLVAPELRDYIRERAQDGAERVSLRFAGAPCGQDACLALGLRAYGKGVDVLIPAAEAAIMRTAPVRLMVGASVDGPDWLEIMWDDETFEEFLDKVGKMRAEFPGNKVWKALCDALLED